MNTRFAVAVHILTLLAWQPEEAKSSDWIAGSVNTNPALIRRLLVLLGRAKLTRAQLGAGGGSRLARPADKITLDDVYRAVDEAGEVIPIHAKPNPRCPVGMNIDGILRKRVEKAEAALHASLAQTTIADLWADVENAAG